MEWGVGGGEDGLGWREARIRDQLLVLRLERVLEEGVGPRGLGGSPLEEAGIQR